MIVQGSDNRNGQKSCKLWFCSRPYYARGYCNTHYQNQRRTGSAVVLGEHDLVATIAGANRMIETLQALCWPRPGRDTPDWMMIGHLALAEGEPVYATEIACAYCNATIQIPSSNEINDLSGFYRIFEHGDGCPIAIGLALLEVYQVVEIDAGSVACDPT